MTVNELRDRLAEEMKWADSLLSDIDGIVYSARIEETGKGAYMFGLVMLGTAEMKDEDKVFISLEGEIDVNDNVNEAKLEGDIAAFREGLSSHAERIRAAEDKAAEIILIGKEIDAEMDKRYQAELDRLNAATKNNLKIAGIATALLLIVAAVCIILEKLI